MLPTVSTDCSNLEYLHNMCGYCFIAGEAASTVALLGESK